MSGYFARLMAKAAPVGSAPRAAAGVAPLEQVVEVESVPVDAARPVAAPADAARAVVPGPTVQRDALPPTAAVPAAPSPMSASMPTRGESTTPVHDATAPARGLETPVLASTQARSALPAFESPSLARPVNSALPGIEPVVPGPQTIHAETRLALDAGLTTPSAVRSVDALDARAALAMQASAFNTALAMPAAIASSTATVIGTTPSPSARADAIAIPPVPFTSTRRDTPARPDVRIGTVSLEVRLPPPPAPAARPAPAAAAPAPAAPRFSLQRYYLRGG
jgi:hypothetical protein